MKKIIQKMKCVLLIALMAISVGTFAQTTKTYTSSSTWTCPMGVTSVQVECWGGGAAGSYASSSSSGSGGGGGGAYSKGNAVAVTAGQTYTIKVGAAGAVVLAYASPGGDGGFSSFELSGTQLVKAAGGKGGSTYLIGGLGGIVSDCIGDVKYKGGDGVTASSGGAGGGGGGGAGSTGAGNNGSGTSGGAAKASNGGAGGAGGTTGGGGSAGSPGFTYGGAGGGSGKKSLSGGTGASGYVILTFTCPSTTAYAGIDQTLAACASSTSLAATVPTYGTGAWTVISGTGTVTTPSSATSAVTGLTPGAATTLRWTVSNGDCGTATDDVVITAVVGPGCLSYCSPTFNLDCSLNDYISNVTINTLNNNSTCGAGGYTNYAATGAQTTTLYQSSSYSLTISVGAGTGNHSAAVWFDFNNNGVFTDAGEYFVISGNTITPNTTTSPISITIPSGATLGTTRMRVRYFYNIAPSSTYSCASTGTYGEVEDYTVTIAAPTPCAGTPAVATPSPSSTSMTPGGTATFSVATSYSGITGLTYQWQSSTDGSTWSNVSGGSGGTADTYTSAALSVKTFFRCIVTCTASGLSATSNTATVLMSYCTPSSLSCTNYRISRVQLVTLDNNSGTTCTGGYSNYSSSVTAPDLTIGSSNTATITVNSATTSSAIVWIDFNADGDFADAGEGFVIDNLSTSGTANIVVPTSATAGVTGMRVRYYYNLSSALTSTSCTSSSTTGETEDYLVNLVCGATPTDVQGKFPANAVSMTCGAEATLNWYNHTCATGYKVYLGTTNPPTTLVSNQTSTIYLTGNLASNTTYYWKIVPYNGAGDGASSVWSFTTNTAITASTAPSQDLCGSSNIVNLVASGGLWTDYFWYDSPTSTTILINNDTFTTTVTTLDTFYVTNSLLGAETNIATASGGTVTCATQGYGNMFDVRAKSANLIITKVSGKFSNTGTQSVKLYYRPGSYVGNAGSSAGWTLAGTVSVSVATTTASTIVDFPDVQIPAGQTYGFYFVYNNQYTSSPGTYANADIEVNTGSTICNTGEFGLEITDRTFNGEVYYKTNCSSPRTMVIATPHIDSNTVILTPANVIGAVEQCTINGWTYYAHPSTPHEWVFGIFKNTNTFTAEVDITEETNAVYANVNNAVLDSSHGSFLLSRYWNATILTGTIDPAKPVKVRFLITAAERAAAITMRDDSMAYYQALTANTLIPTPWRWFKTVGTRFNPTTIGIDGNDFSAFDNVTLNEVGSGVLNGVAYVDLDGVESFSGGTGGVGFSVFNGVGLPVGYLSFTAKAIENSYIKLDWSTASEIYNKGFDIERSEDGVNFTRIGWVDGNGNSTTVHYYTLNDNNVVADVVYYYRLRQVDNSGRATYSAIVSAKISGEDKFTVSDFIPTKVEGKTHIEIYTTTDRNISIEIYNTLGQKVEAKEAQLQKGTSNVEFDFSHLASGTYSASIRSNGEFIGRKFLVVK